MTRDDDIRTNAQAQVDTFLEILRDRYGLRDEDIAQLADDLVRLHKRVQFARRMGEWTAQTIVGVLVVAFLGGIAWAFIRFIEDHAK